MTAKAICLLLPLVGAARAAREARADLGILEVERPRLQEMKLDSLQQVINSAAAGETLLWRRLTGQPTQDRPLRTLEAYQIDSTAKLRQAMGAAVQLECFGAVLDPLHRCHKAFPIYDFVLTAMLITSPGSDQTVL
eukprot:g17143.t1